MGLFDKFKKQKNQEIISINEDGEVIDVSVPVEMVPFEEYPEESALVEIKDDRIISHINQAIPELFKVGFGIGKAITESSQVLYKAILPPGAKLSQSRDMAGAVRGFYHGAGGKIAGHANLVAANKAANVVSNIASSAMGIASLIVGQYYMDQINSELSKISDTIEQVANFQNNEYKSKVSTLFDCIQREAYFQSNTLESIETRQAKNTNLIAWEKECIELLRQANSKLNDMFEKKSYEFDKYEKELTEIQTWYVYQQTLLNLLHQVADLRHTLSLGALSKEECYSLIPKCEKETKATNKQLQEWHESYAKKFELNAEAKTRKHDGLVGMLMFLPGLLHQDWQICSVSDKTLELIAEQSAAYDNPVKQPQTDLFQENVTLIAKEGKVYYLPK